MPSTLWFSLILQFQVPCFLITSPCTSNPLPLDNLTPKILLPHQDDQSIGGTISQFTHVLLFLPSKESMVYCYKHSSVNTLNSSALPSVAPARLSPKLIKPCYNLLWACNPHSWQFLDLKKHIPYNHKSQIGMKVYKLQSPTLQKCWSLFLSPQISCLCALPPFTLSYILLEKNK